ncbi:DNA replication/repair protein RecF [Corallincola platygyrae]|uniref:DNA replication and repair protein RecF n=1 Tax=Corallincola platygyrae TaxID=1193278 RepID=A0ABW4XKU1_9GAMM
MSITRLQISNLRNLKKVGLQLGPTFNFFFGENGAGKTSLLEALYIIHAGRSFRTSDLNKVISSSESALTVFLERQSEEEGVTKIGLMRERSGGFSAKVDGENVSTLSQLSALLPTQILSPESFSLLSGGSKERRKYIDWGVFHVEHSFHNLWRRCQRLLVQRNSLLKRRVSHRELQPWDKEFSSVAHELNLLRQRYIDKLLPYFSTLAQAFFPEYEVKFSFHPGWNQSETLADVLSRDIERDQKYGHTQSGPHRANFHIRVNGQAAESICSRGQLKLLVCCLKLAQAKHLFEWRGLKPVFLLDDIESELDGTNRQRVLEQLRTLGSQVLISLINVEAISEQLEESDRVFHVEQGYITPWQIKGDNTTNNND